MESELIELIMIYLRNNKYADYEFINEAINISMFYNNLDNYIKEKSFEKNSNKHVLASYSPVYSKLSIDYSKLIDFYFNNIKQINLYKNDNEKILQCNISVLQTLLHEIEHVIQYKRCNEDTTIDIELQLLKKSYEKAIYIQNNLNGLEALDTNKLEFFNDMDKLYYSGEYYEVDPKERMAEIKSRNMLLKLLSSLKYEYKLTYELIRFDYLLKLTMGYSFSKFEVQTPINKFYEIRRHLLEKYNLRKDEPIVIGKLNIYQKFLYGSELNFEDKYKLHQEIEKIKRKLK